METAAPTSALYETILSQPAVIEAVLAGAAEWAPRAADLLGATSRVFLTGTGTSSHAAVVGEHLLRSVGIDAYASTNFDFVTYPRALRDGDAVIVISHRGAKTYGNGAIARAREAGAPVIGITGQDSPMAGPDLVIATAPQERSATHTASYTGNLTALASIAIAAGQRRGADTGVLRAALDGVPAALLAVLDGAEAVRPFAQALASSRRLTLAGAGPNAVTAREGALKVKESSFLTAEGFELETLLHGGLQAIQAGDVAVVIAASGPALARTRDAINALALIGTRLLVVADERVAGDLAAIDGATVLGFPAVPEPLSPMLAVAPLQLLAAFTAQIVGTNADAFRADEPLYKRVNESYKL